MSEQRPRGRPRPQETIDRDRKILERLRAQGPQTRNALAEDLGENKSRVWLSLNRLRNDGLIRKCTSAAEGSSEMVWTAEVDQPCP
jgi:predicted transcriptional regulator